MNFSSILTYTPTFGFSNQYFTVNDIKTHRTRGRGAGPETTLPGNSSKLTPLTVPEIFWARVGS